MALGSRAEFRSRCAVVRRGSAIRPKIEVTADEAANLLDGLVSVNLGQIHKALGGVRRLGQEGTFPILTGIQRGTVVYDRYDPDEEWKTWRQLMDEIRTHGKATGDCEDLASAVAAELVYAGIPARTYVYQSAPSLYHVIVKTDKWGLLDPSRSAGMT